MDFRKELKKRIQKYLPKIVSDKLGAEFTQKEILLMMIDAFDLPPNEVVEVLDHISKKYKLKTVIYTPVMFKKVMTEIGAFATNSTNN
tara:strand:- start:166 stop:429 length:264 start_codon:yes stop_codon:yes gene_type:complete